MNANESTVRVPACPFRSASSGPLSQDCLSLATGSDGGVSVFSTEACSAGFTICVVSVAALEADAGLELRGRQHHASGLSVASTAFLVRDMRDKRKGSGKASDRRDCLMRRAKRGEQCKEQVTGRASHWAGQSVTHFVSSATRAGDDCKLLTACVLLSQT